MTETEIKKALYKEKPIASKILDLIDQEVFETSLEDGTVIYFEIPKEEIYENFDSMKIDNGERRIQEKEPAQLLIRWLLD